MDTALSLPFDEDLAFIFAIDTGQYLDQGRLSGTVLSHQRMDFTLARVKVHSLQGTYTGKAFVYIFHFQYCVIVTSFTPFCISQPVIHECSECCTKNIYVLWRPHRNKVL